MRDNESRTWSDIRALVEGAVLGGEVTILLAQAGEETATSSLTFTSLLLVGRTVALVLTYVKREGEKRGDDEQPRA
jgi:hypothetical protein